MNIIKFFEDDYLIIGSEDATITILNTETKKIIVKFIGHTNRYSSFIFFFKNKTQKN